MSNKEKITRKSGNKPKDTKELLNQLGDEFKPGVTDEFNLEEMPEKSRRRFLALMGASAAFAATACTDYRDKGEIVNYNKKPEEVTMGKANYYASTLDNGLGILIKTREGRPVKIDGNPEHPLNKGKIDARGQASLMDLYDPDRIRFPQMYDDSTLEFDRFFKKKTKWDVIDKKIIEKLENAVAANKEIALFTKNSSSPTFLKLLSDFKAKYPTTNVYSYDVVNGTARDAAWEECYGSKKYPGIDFAKANIILTFESDILGNDGNTVEQTQAVTGRRDHEKLDHFNRVYAVEGGFSLTGANADYRLRLTPEAHLELILALANQLSNGSVPGIGSYRLDNIASKHNLNKETIKHLLEDLKHNKGKAVVSVGTIHSKETHIAANLLNEILGAGDLYLNNHYTTTMFNSSQEEIENLVADMNSGKVELFISIDANPSFDLPSDYGFKEALKKVPEVIAMTQLENETSAHAGFLLPINHTFESWGDVGGRVGVISLRQPVISPIHDTRQKEALLLTWIEGADKYSEDIYHKYLMRRWETEEFPKIAKIGSFEKFWYSALHDGFVSFEPKMGEGEHPQIQFNYDAVSRIKPVSKSGFTVVIANSLIGDGTAANNGWLQEIPHPVSKVVWDNYAAVSPATSKKLNLKDNDLIELDINGRKQTLPVWVQSGTADDLVYTEIGYGREKGGTVGTGVGVNVNSLMSKKGGLSERIFTGVKVSKVEGEYKLVATQEHHQLDEEFVKDFHKIRDIIQEGTVDQYKENPHFLHAHNHEVISITPDIEYPNEKWAMAVDLNKCTGCSLCVAACNVENNVPIVGKEETSKGREMHWMRIDRYYSGTPEEPEASIQPMICQHCDNAPCENVCPVVATTHSPDGLNQMVYNRCVGTRYCANNCPYKVRRFNFFDFREMFEDGYQYSDSLKLINNPEVTVRSRGVMEKCTFCVQRITEARQVATEKGEQFKGAGITTACQDACPADAIVFGNVNDPESKISKLAKHDLGYHVMEMLNVRPNVTYLAKLRNKHTNGGHGEH